MFKVSWKGHFFQPLAICDSCGEAIEDAAAAMFTWGRDKEQIFLVHTAHVASLWLGNEENKLGEMYVMEFLANLAVEQAAVAGS